MINLLKHFFKAITTKDSLNKRTFYVKVPKCSHWVR